MRALLVVMVLGLALVPTRDVEACSCVARTFAQHAKAAARVMIARAGKPVKTGDALKQTFTVLATLKGPADAQFLLDRPATPPCASSYADGEVAILFTSGGDLDPCHGNQPLDTQLADLPSIVATTRTKSTAAPKEAVELALREALTPFLHDRPAISVRHAALAGTSIELGRSRLTYRAKKAAKDIEISSAIAIGSIAVVQGAYRTEGVRFTVLLQLDKTWSVIKSSATES